MHRPWQVGAPCSGAQSRCSRLLAAHALTLALKDNLSDRPGESNADPARAAWSWYGSGRHNRTRYDLCAALSGMRHRESASGGRLYVMREGDRPREGDAGPPSDALGTRRARHPVPRRPGRDRITSLFGWRARTATAVGGQPCGLWTRRPGEVAWRRARCVWVASRRGDRGSNPPIVLVSAREGSRSRSRVGH